MARFRLPDSGWAWVLGLGWIFILFMEPIRDWLDDRIHGSGWLEVQIEVSDEAEARTGKPSILYTRYINRTLSGTWGAWVQLEDGTRICGGGDHGNYDPKKSGLITMPWAYFIGRDCDVPTASYRICANYILRDNRDRRRFFGPFCSELKKP